MDQQPKASILSREFETLFLQDAYQMETCTIVFRIYAPISTPPQLETKALAPQSSNLAPFRRAMIVNANPRQLRVRYASL